ncbi:MAG TPA: lasso peptide biosynthesis B2 protein [Gemmatimonadaceae bacterium]|nr:lasso peptide biosynthesis B2 protein [Gemmatimonadaceae bacterium]
MIGRVQALLGALVRRRADVGPLARALWLLPLTTARLRNSRRAADAREALRRNGPIEAVSASQLARAVRLQRVVQLASVYGVTEGTCLSRSLTLLDLMGREHLPGVLRIGVRSPRAALGAHAWVECGGVVLNDVRAAVERYSAFEAEA